MEGGVMAAAPTVSAMETILALGRPDQAIQADELPWVPQGDQVWFKPLRFDLATGRWINLLKVTKQGRVNRHRHSGGQVLGFVIAGSWRYLERDWVARPGDVFTKLDRYLTFCRREGIAPRDLCF
jgi:hypothetical protein